MTNDSQLAQDAKTIPESAREVLWQLFSRGPLPTPMVGGSLISGREWLIGHSYVDWVRQGGWVFLTRDGIALAQALSLDLRKARSLK